MKTVFIWVKLKSRQQYSSLKQKHTTRWTWTFILFIPFSWTHTVIFRPLSHTHANPLPCDVISHATSPPSLHQNPTSIVTSGPTKNITFDSAVSIFDAQQLNNDWTRQFVEWCGGTCQAKLNTLCCSTTLQ